MAMLLQIVGGLIVATALMQACVGLVSQFNSALRIRKLEKRKLELLMTRTRHLAEQAEVDRERSELTWAGKRKFRIVEKRTENKKGDICSFYLAPHDGGKLPAFQPGQFLTFDLKVPDHIAPVIRCYSLSDSPSSLERYRVTIKRLPPPPTVKYRVPGGLSSTYFHDLLAEGDVVDVMAPNGSFQLNTQSDRPVVLIGGGIGLTPVLSMLKWLSDTNSHREVWFFYAVKDCSEVALNDEIKEIVAGHSNFHSVVFFSEPTKKCLAGKDYDHKGFLDVNSLKSHLKTSNYEFYLCGPPAMMQALTDQLTEWGVPEADMNMEAFGPASIKKVAKADETKNDLQEDVTVEFARSGTSLTWTPAAGTLLELAETNGIRINFGCRAGNCSTCLTALKKGKVSYISSPATPLANGSTLVCIAQPDGDISLDA